MMHLNSLNKMSLSDKTLLYGQFAWQFFVYIHQKKFTLVKPGRIYDRRLRNSNNFEKLAHIARQALQS